MMAGFSQAQYISLVTALCTSGSLSMLGSSLIIRMAATSLKSKKDQDKTVQSYNRLLIGLSCGDLFFSTFIILNPFMVPREYRADNLAAIGTTASCTAAGFLMLSGAMVVAIYNSTLSFYFLFRVRFKWRPEEILTRLERPAHVLAWTVPFLIGIYGLINQVYNPHFHICVFNDYPSGCTDPESDMECLRGANDETASKIFAILVGLTSVAGFIATISVYCFVQSQLKRNQRYAFASHPSNRRTPSADSASVLVTSNEEREESENNIHQELSQAFATTTNNNSHNSTSRRTDFSGQVQPTTSTSSAQAVLLQEQSQSSSNFLSSVTSRALSRRHRGSSATSLSASDHLAREVAIQAILYSVAYLNSFIWPIIVSVVFENIGTAELDKRQGDPDLFATQLLMGFLYPLQGFWNLLIYIRPRWASWRKSDPSLSTWQIWNRILASEPVPQLRRGGASSTRHNPPHGQTASSFVATGAASSRNTNGNDSGHEIANGDSITTDTSRTPPTLFGPSMTTTSTTLLPHQEQDEQDEPQ